MTPGRIPISPPSGKKAGKEKEIKLEQKHYKFEGLRTDKLQSLTTPYHSEKKAVYNIIKFTPLSLKVDMDINYSTPNIRLTC